jgi:tetratricopeptide (TPR) repeat protein
MRVPLVFALPGTIPGQRRFAKPVRTADIAPTVLELAGLPPLSDIQGVSLAPLLLDQGAAPQLDIYGESFEPLSMFGTNVLRFLRRGKWKYVHKVNPELFDLSADPAELVNVASQHPEVVAELRRDLVAWVLSDRIERSDNRSQIDDEALEQLQALGYMGEGAPSGFSEADDLAALEGDDPVARLGEMEIYSMAFAAVKAGLMDKALAHFDQLYLTNPDSLPVVRGLIRVLEGDARLERGPGLLEKAKLLEPDNPVHYIRAGEIQHERGDRDAAEREFRQALVVDPCRAAARVVFAEMLREWDRIGDQQALLEEGIERCDDDINFRNDLAYLLATTADATVRDGAYALRLAKQVVADAEIERPDYLDTLACAWAEVGNFRKALRHSRRALELIETRDMGEEIVSEYRAHLEALENARPIRSGSS